MKQLKPSKGEKYRRVNPFTKQEEVLTATGTRREIKYVEMDFFTNDKGETVFFYPSEVERDFVKL